MIQKIKINGKKVPFAIWLTLAALFLELFVCNFSSFESLFFGKELSFEEITPEGEAVSAAENGFYRTQDGSFTVKLPAEGKEIHNLYFDMEFTLGEVIPYTVTLTDEGNFYPYTLPESEIAPEVEKTHYTKLYPSGRVGELFVKFVVPEGCELRVNAVKCNVSVPVWFHLGRFLVILCTLFFLYYVGKPGRIHEPLCFLKGGTARRMQLAAAAAVALLLMGMAWKLAHVNPVCITSPWPHHKQYQELAQAMAKGQLYLDAEPSAELKNAKNPYDTIYLQANGIDYLADYAYHDGKYYVYFGVVPELLLYLPCYLLTGKLFPNWLAVFFFFCGFIAAVFGLYREMIKRWFVKTPFIAYLLLGILTVCCGNYMFVIARPDLYDTPIMAASMFTVAGLWLWIRGKNAAAARGRRVCFAAGSLCMALVAGCRPQMLLFSFLAVPLFWEEVVRKRRLFSIRSLGDTASLFTPYVLVAAGIMYYNAARFGSPFDFGAVYSLTSNDMTKRSFHVQQALLGLWHYFLQPPVIGSDFPFLQGNQITSASYMGKLNAEYTYGGILLCNAFMWIAFFTGKARNALKQKGLWGLFLTGAAISVVLGIVDVTGAGILQRYMVDMIWGLWLSAAVLWLLLLEKEKGTKNYRTVMILLAAVCLLQAAYAFGVVFGNGDLSVNVRTSNPVLYQEIKMLLRF